MRIGIGVTGASGVVVAERLIEALKEKNIDIFTIVSNGAEKVFQAEGVRQIKGDYRDDDLSAAVASSSNSWDAFVIVPATVKTLSAVANAYTSTLIARVADNCLKMKRRLVVCPRETPLSLPQVENMKKLLLAGAIVMPLNIAYYHRPKKVDDITDFFVGKIMDCLGIDNDLYKRWKS